jgi:mono/diheme cytochrome c family protein
MRKSGGHVFFALLLAAGSVTLLLAAAVADNHEPTGRGQDHLHHHHFAEFAKSPEPARARPNPLETDPNAVVAGKKLFHQHCAECHGASAEGGRKAPSLRAEEVRQATPGTLFWILSNGVVRRGMPVWSKLPEPERWQIVAFIKSLPPSRDSDLHEAHSSNHSMPMTTCKAGPQQ